MVNSILVQTDGKIVCGGDFTTYNGSAKIGLIRLTSSGANDSTFLNLNTGDVVYDTAQQSDGKILVCGLLSLYGATVVSNLFRINTDGSYDSTFSTGFGFSGIVTNIAIQNNGKIVCSGQFSNYDGVQAFGIVRINTDGSIDTNWNYGSGLDAANENQPITIQSNGNILLGGTFTTFDSEPYNNIVALLP